MKKSILIAGLALAAAVASTFYAPTAAWARAEGTWLWNTFTLTATQSMNVASTATFTGNMLTVTPAAQVIAAGGTIAADACGGLKRISAASDVTTDTTNTIAAPSASNAGCAMMIVNMSATQTIYLDSNTAFPLTNVASAALGPNGSIEVVSDGTFWLHQRWTEY